MDSKTNSASGGTMQSKRNLAARMGGWSVRHRWTALGLWLAFVVAAVVGGAVAGEVDLTNPQLGDGESGHAARVIDSAGYQKSAGEMVLIKTPSGTVRGTAGRAAIADTVNTLDGFSTVRRVHNPLTGDTSGRIAKDGRSAIVTFDVLGDETAADKAIVPVMDAVSGVAGRHPGVEVQEFGEASASHVLNDKINQDFARARTVSLPLTLLILLFAFGAMVAAGVPVLLAFSAVLATFGLNSLFSHVMGTTQTSAEVILMIGMAVGVDYSLFYLRRERDERSVTKTADRARISEAKAARKQAKRAGDAEAIAAAQASLKQAKAISRSNRERALDIAASTSGQAVLISGVTVLIAMAGMLLAGDPVFVTLGISAMLVVAVALVGSLTGLPAVLSILGDRVERGRIPFLARLTRGSDGGSRFWGAIVDRVLKRPAVSVVLAGGLLIALALPALALKTETPSFRFLPQNLTIVKTYKQIQADFPGGPDPAVVALKAKDVTSPDVQAEITTFKRAALATGEMTAPIDVKVNPDHTVAQIAVPLAGDGQNAASQHALKTLRTDVIPTTLDRIPNADVSVTGGTAAAVDFNDLMGVRTPIVFAFVLGLAFLLMLVTFHSIVIPIKAILLNLLSVAAAYGILVAIFQHGIGQSLIGFHSTGTIANWLPLFLFVVLFGLSMDYHVFILSRVKELVDGGMPTEDAVATGIRSTAGVVTSAAVVMVGVFALFGTLSVLDVKQFGVGAAIAVLLDATIVRAVLLPASMKLLGEWNWYMPRSLSWLPRLQHAAPAPSADPQKA
jgi:RND superfamily putative drug exporter